MYRNIGILNELFVIYSCFNFKSCSLFLLSNFYFIFIIIILNFLLNVFVTFCFLIGIYEAGT